MIILNCNHTVIFYLLLLNYLYSLGKRIVDRLISSPVGSKDGIHATIDTPYGKNPMMNVYQPHVLRQYFSKNVDTKPCKDGYIYRYSYGTGTGSNTLGIDPTNFMTRPFSHEIDVMEKRSMNLYIEIGKDST